MRKAFVLGQLHSHEVEIDPGSKKASDILDRFDVLIESSIRMFHENATPAKTDLDTGSDDEQPK